MMGNSHYARQKQIAENFNSWISRPKA